ncbi:MAG TPA: hypothetical protein VI260_27600, partial [Blastocatellia bacterium]
MISRKRVRRLINCTMALALSLSISTFAEQAQEKKAPPDAIPILWLQPSDIASRDLLLGPGGEAMQPDLSRVTFIKEQKGGYSTKYRVRDAQGREWI